MGRKITFVHAADCHLGASFKGLQLASGTIGERLVDAVDDAFLKVVGTCVERHVDFLVLAGDTFNEGEVPYRVQNLFAQAMRRLDDAGIMVYLCTGNHDPLATWSARLGTLPDNVCIFPSDEPGYFVYERSGIPLAVLAGRSYETGDEPGDLTPGLDRRSALAAVGEEVPFAVGVLHTGITAPRYAPCDPSRLQTSGFDYYALGHIHERGSVGSLAVTYAGSPQGLDINEDSEHGCTLVTLEEMRVPVLETVQTAAVIWERPVVDVSEVGTFDELAQLLTGLGRDLVARHRRPVCARITLTGQSPLHAHLTDTADLDDLRDMLTGSCSSGTVWFWAERIVDRTSACLDLATLRTEGLFPALLMDEADALLADGEAARRLVRQRLDELGLSRMEATEDLAALVERARTICLDGLMEEGR